VDGKLVRLASSIWERMNERKKRGKTLVVKLGPLIGVALFVVSTFFFWWPACLLPSFDPGRTCVEFNPWMIGPIWRTDGVSCGSRVRHLIFFFFLFGSENDGH
jgi:hypothetical protein